MPYVHPPPDPMPDEALALLKRLGCSYRLKAFFPGPGNPASRYPIEVVAPPGFHFADRQHTLFLPDWHSVIDRLAGTTIVPCDDDCDDVDSGARA